jgi:hypothetical protein
VKVIIDTKRKEKVKSNEVRGHRILKNTFPKLELYIHYAVSSSRTDRNKEIIGHRGFVISQEDGIAISPKLYESMWACVHSVKRLIEHYGEDEVLKRTEERLRHLSNNNI